MDNGFNVRDEYKDLTVPQLKEIQERGSLPFEVMTLNLNGDLNVGMIIRSAALMGASRVHIFGRRRIDRRSLVGVQNYMNMVRQWGLDDEEDLCYTKFEQYVKSSQLNPIFIEQGGIELHKVDWSKHTNPCFVFGNEGSGIPDEFLNSSYPTISIPQTGVRRSFNVSAAASIVMWDYISRGCHLK